jgi:hypothetical protein
MLTPTPNDTRVRRVRMMAMQSVKREAASSWMRDWRRAARTSS